MVARPPVREGIVIDLGHQDVATGLTRIRQLNPRRVEGAQVYVDPAIVEQVVGGCVSQAGEQAFNITRTAWLAAGLPLSAAATTVDTQCGSSQQATGLAASLIGSGVVDVAVACGVESMSRVPIGASGAKQLGLGIPMPPPYFDQYEMTSQFEGAERIADKWGITREDQDRRERPGEAHDAPLEAPRCGVAGTAGLEGRTASTWR